MATLSLADVFSARRRLQGRVDKSPLIPSSSLSEIAQTPVFLKLETVHPTGSFKLRGATNAVVALKDSGCQRVVTASTGNHGRAVAYAARSLGIEAVVCMSSLVPGNKVDAIRALGARVRIVGKSQDDAQVDANRLATEDGYTYLSPFDDLNVIAGQATIGLEIIESLPDVANIVVPLSGGGLFAGVAFAAKQANPEIVMTGVSMARGASMHASLEAGRPVLTDEVESLADSLGGGIGLNNQYSFSLTKELIDNCILVDEASIARGIVHAYSKERQVIEGGAAVGLSVVLDFLISADQRQRGPMVLVVTGANIDIEKHRQLVGTGFMNIKTDKAL